MPETAARAVVEEAASGVRRVVEPRSVCFPVSVVGGAPVREEGVVVPAGWSALDPADAVRLLHREAARADWTVLLDVTGAGGSGACGGRSKCWRSMSARLARVRSIVFASRRWCSSAVGRSWSWRVSTGFARVRIRGSSRLDAGWALRRRRVTSGSVHSVSPDRGASERVRAARRGTALCRGRGEPAWRARVIADGDQGDRQRHHHRHSEVVERVVLARAVHGVVFEDGGDGHFGVVQRMVSSHQRRLVQWMQRWDSACTIRPQVPASMGRSTPTQHRLRASRARRMCSRRRVRQIAHPGPASPLLAEGQQRPLVGRLVDEDVPAGVEATRSPR